MEKQCNALPYNGGIENPPVFAIHRCMHCMCLIQATHNFCIHAATELVCSQKFTANARRITLAPILHEENPLKLSIYTAHAL